MAKASTRRGRYGPGRIWSITGADLVTVGNLSYPPPGLGEPGDFAFVLTTGALYGPKASAVGGYPRFSPTNSPWPASPMLYGRLSGASTSGNTPANVPIGNGVACTSLPNEFSEGAAIPAGFLHQQSVLNTWNSTAKGWRIRGTMAQQWGNTYADPEHAKGGSIYFKLTRIPDSGFGIQVGVGAVYGALLPSIQVMGGGAISWQGGAAHSVGTTLATAQVNDEFYLSGVNGKYDFQLVRSGTLIASSTNFYNILDQYTLYGIMGFAPVGAPSDAQAGCVKDVAIIAGF